MSLCYCEVLFLGIDYPNCRWQLGHVSNTFEVLGEFFALTTENQKFFLGQGLVIASFKSFQFLQALNSLVYGWEVGQHSTQPTLGYIRHSDASRLLLDWLVRLLLSSNEQDVSALSNGVLNERISAIDQG